MKVLLVDDHPLVLSALQAVIQGIGDDTTVLGADSAAAARKLLAADPEIDLVLLDLALGDDDGFAVLIEFRAAYPETPVVVVSASDRASDVIRAIDSGAMGFVPKKSAHSDLYEALHMVIRGAMFVPPSLLGLVSAAEPDMVGDTEPGVMQLADGSLGPHSRPEPRQKLPRLEDVGLTPRQTEVLSLLLQGLPNKLIARQLNLSVETVKDHVAAVLRALGVSTRTQAVLAVSQMTQAQGGYVARKPPGR